MIKHDNNLWWHPDYGFFSIEFYFKGDSSKKGFSPTNPLSLSQRTKREVEFIIKYLKPKEGALFLDCPCGYGRHLIELAKKGFRVTGIDINKPFLEHGLQESAKLNLNSHANFFEMDMLKMNFSENSFDFAINMFTSFGFFESDTDNEIVLSNFYKVLKPKGQLLLYFDYNATRIIDHRYFNGDENKNRKCLFNNKKYDLWISESYDKATKRLIGTWTLRNGSEPITKEYSIRIYSNDELKELLISNGFKSVRFFDPNNKSFTDNSKETIIVATK